MESLKRREADGSCADGVRWGQVWTLEGRVRRSLGQLGDVDV